MKYKDSAAFRKALETRLRTQSRESGVPLVRLRKMVAFERFLTRLIAEQPDVWVLKGGMALQLRLGARARTTKDVDLLLKDVSFGDIHQMLVRAALCDIGDWFRFEVARPLRKVQRFSVRSLLDGRVFEDFHVDVGTGDVLVEPPDYLEPPALLAFADILPSPIPCYPLTQQIAEKFHAYTRSYATTASTRVKDWVDILLMAELGTMQAFRLQQALQATFETRQTHPLPERTPEPPATWRPYFRRLRREIGLSRASLEEAHRAIGKFLDPVLQGQDAGIWNPVTWDWE